MLMSVPPVLPTGTIPTAEPNAPRIIWSACPNPSAGEWRLTAILRHRPMRTDVRHDIALPQHMRPLQMPHRMIQQVTCLNQARRVRHFRFECSHQLSFHRYIASMELYDAPEALGHGVDQWSFEPGFFDDDPGQGAEKRDQVLHFALRQPDRFEFAVTGRRWAPYRNAGPRRRAKRTGRHACRARARPHCAGSAS